MNRLLIGLLICLLAFINCSKIDKKKADIVDFTHSEQVEKSNIQTNQKNTNSLQPHIDNEIIIPKMDITRANIFAAFPQSPDYFIENNINVTIERTDNRSSPFPTYFGIEPVYVTGENFRIIYATDNGYEIRLVDLNGKSIFLYWNQFFNITWEQIKKSWGEPDAITKSYFDDTGQYYIGFSIDKITGKIKNIQIGQNL